ncbi:MAG: DUF1156 domain-containing protein, partial [Bacteroidetes bacterium]|nr:DUF1156 domain-containing protein [Bacteroidota bacterium]
KEWELGGKQGLCPVPDEPTPAGGGSGAGRAFSVQRYGMMQWGDLFTARQKVALLVITDLMKSVCDQGTLSVMAFAMGKMLRHCNALSKWHRGSETTAGAFGMHALPMSWDFPEMPPSAPYAGGIHNSFNDLIKSISSITNLMYFNKGQVMVADAADHILPDQSVDIWFTDPPYYDAIPYADLSDFYLVWMKRVLPELHQLQDPFNSGNHLSPKQQEIVQDETKRHNDLIKDDRWFEKRMQKAFSEGRRVLKEEGIGSVVFAHKTTEGWEALLSGIIEGGWIVTGSWPISTERGARLRAQESAALATSIHLICRPRPMNSQIGDWSDVLRKLPQLVHRWVHRLQCEGIRGADLVFACIGPALEIFSKYRSVETAEGNKVKLSDYLEKVWEVVGRTALERVLNISGNTSYVGTTIVIEEDARLTALFLWTIQSTDDLNDNIEEGNKEPQKTVVKSNALPFDVVRRFAQPMGIDLDRWTSKIITQKQGIVRLMPVMDRSKELFGEDGANQVAEWIESDIAETNQTSLFPEMTPESTSSKSRTSKSFVGKDFEFESEDATVLDRVHAAMLFQAGGQSGALRTLIASELSRGPEFLHLANALSALYPIGSQEKRLLDAMLLAVPR